MKNKSCHELEHTLHELEDEVTRLKQTEIAFYEQERQSQVLLLLLQKLEQSHNYSDITEVALEAIKEITCYRSVGILLFLDNKEHLTLVSNKGAMARKVAAEYTIIPVKGDKFLQECLSSDIPTIIENARVDPRCNKEIVAALENWTIINIPIIFMGRHIGLFNTGTWGDEGIKVPTQTESDFLLTVAKYVAAAYNRVFLDDKRQQAEDALLKANTALEEKVHQRTQDLKKKNLLLHEAEKKFRIIADFAYDWESWESSDGTNAYTSPACEKISGYPVEIFQNDPTFFESIIIPEDQEVWRQHHHDVDRNPLPREIQLRIQKKDGEIIWLEHACCPVIDEDGLYHGIRASNRDVTIRKQVENDLEKSKEKYRLLAETIIDIIWVYNLTNQKFTYISPSVFQLRGFSVEEAMQESLHDSLTLESAQKIINLIPQRIDQFKKGHTDNFKDELQQKCKDGSVIWIEIITRFQLAEDETLEALGVSRDITERKKIENELRRYESMISITNDHMSFVDSNYIYRTVSKSYLQAHNKSSQEIIGHSVADCVGIDSFEKIIKNNLDRCLTGNVVHYQAWFDFHQDGLRYMDVFYYPYTDANDDIAGVIVSSHDVTGLKHAEQAMLKNKEQLQRYLNAIDDIKLGLFVVDADYHIRHMNQTMVNWFGDQHNNICYESVAGLDSPCPYCRLKEVVETGKTVKYRPSTSGDQIFDIIASPIGNSDGGISNMEIFRDITEQKIREEQRLKINQQREQLVRVESLKTMAGAIAHRFNNAMMAVQGNLELMVDVLPADSDEYKMASDAAKAASGASQVGSMMLRYVGQQPLKLREIPLDTLVNECVTSFKSLLRPSISLQFTSPDRPLYCSVDPKQLKEVIESIITNAVESLNDTVGTIEITFGTDYFKAGSFPISFQSDTLQDDIYTFCQIKDSGHGINPKDLSKIFDPFFTTRFVGRGLGLALAVGIMQSHHGALTVMSHQDKGTTVKVLLPSISPTRQTTAPSDEKTSRGGIVQLSGNILLADDDEMILDVGRKMLELMGFTVHTAINGQEAVDKIDRGEIDFRAAILDISMPELDGIEAMQTIRKSNSALPILLSSGYSEDDFTFKEGEENKPDGFLSKPFELSDMRNSLEKLLS